ncbi:type II secretion system protein GspG [Candidatus Saccharibacteria bacterium]|nr:type II secretion system protein GspG [Candidatus Saccharibacteria bacterium]
MKRSSSPLASAASKGFSITELILVIVVLAIIGVIASSTYNSSAQRSRIQKANADMTQLKRVMLNYKDRKGELPPVGDAWNGDTNPPSAPEWERTIDALKTEGLVNNEAPTRDPWGTPYGYDDNDCLSGASDYVSSDIYSSGPDRLAYTSDDIWMNISRGCRT